MVDSTITRRLDAGCDAAHLVEIALSHIQWICQSGDLNDLLGLSQSHTHAIVESTS